MACPDGTRRRRLEAAALGDADLQGDEVDAGGALGDGVLDLQPGVHLEEEEAAVVTGEELDGAGAGVADRPRGGDRGGEQRLAHPRHPLDERRRRLLDDLLVAALDRALALAERPHRAVLVGEHLDLDVAACRQVRLAEHGGVAERRRRLGPGGGDLAVEHVERAHDAHAPSAAAGRGLDQHRQVAVGDGVGGQLGEDRHAGGGHQPLGLDLRAHRRDRRRRRADPRQPGVDDGAGEGGVLGQEAVAGMDGVGAGAARRVDDQVAAQVGVGGRVAGQAPRRRRPRRRAASGVGVGVDGDVAMPRSRQVRITRRAISPRLATRTDLDHGRKTPKRSVPRTGALCAADRAMPSTVRVSRGSMIPSS